MPQTWVQPERSAARSETLDAVRAVALLGVLAINMLTISGLAFLTPEARAALGGPAGQAADALAAVFVQGKALAAFSFLFGLSFSILIRNAMVRGESFMGFYLRRLAVLGLFGLINAELFFWGDILTTYAVLGLILPLAAQLRLRTVLGLVAALILVAPAAAAMLGVAPTGPRTVPQTESLVIFASPRFSDTVAHNWELFTGAVGSGDGAARLLRYSTLAGLFLLGLGVGRLGWMQRLGELRLRLRPAAWGLVAVGVVAEGLLALRIAHGPVATALRPGGVLMALGYVALVALWLDTARGAWARQLLAPLGRMALTGYLMGGLAGQAVFHGWGLDLIGRVGALEALAWAVLIYCGLILFAHLWLRGFVMGPWEWMWRCLSRMRRQPLLRPEIA